MYASVDDHMHMMTIKVPSHAYDQTKFKLKFDQLTARSSLYRSQLAKTQ